MAKAKLKRKRAKKPQKVVYKMVGVEPPVLNKLERAKKSFNCNSLSSTIDHLLGENKKWQKKKK